MKEKFRQAGNIEFVEIWKKDGRSRGCGIIKFSSSSEAQKAVGKLNGKKINDLMLIIDKILLLTKNYSMVHVSKDELSKSNSIKCKH